MTGGPAARPLAVQLAAAAAAAAGGRRYRQPRQPSRLARGRGAGRAGDDLAGPEDERDSLTDVPGGVRLQKVLAAAGVASRRRCEEMIGEGRVEVDGEIVRRYGARVDPQRQVIRVDGRRIPASEDLVYLALNKPAGVLTTMSDGRGRPTIADYLGDRGERLFHVGRLDYDTEGLMLLDERRRAGAPARAPQLRRAEDLPRGRARAAAPRSRPSAGHRDRA